MISVLVLTLSEEVNIADCLDSVAWADDVLVPDSGSEDRTVEIARSKGARVLYRDFDDFASQRNYGLEEGELRHDWVLHLDADERVTPALREALRDRAECGEHRAYRVPSKLMFQGQWLKHAGMYPTYQVRFGRREALTFTQVGHGQRGALPADQVGTLRRVGGPSRTSPTRFPFGPCFGSCTCTWGASACWTGGRASTTRSCWRSTSTSSASSGASTGVGVAAPMGRSQRIPRWRRRRGRREGSELFAALEGRTRVENGAPG